MKQERGYTIGAVREVGGTRGWFVGHFMAERGFPTLQTDKVEMAVMELPLEDPSKPHYHKISTEITYVISGKLTLVFGHLNNLAVQKVVEVEAGQFFIVEPGVVLQNPKNDPDTRIVVVKTPSVSGDKYYIE